jgi:hypothetical protein
MVKQLLILTLFPTLTSWSHLGYILNVLMALRRARPRAGAWQGPPTVRIYDVVLWLWRANRNLNYFHGIISFFFIKERHRYGFFNCIGQTCAPPRRATLDPHRRWPMRARIKRFSQRSRNTQRFYHTLQLLYSAPHCSI